ncbi:hypothetical protein [Neobacillus thermocopriae]|uniref:hypothetical protein n=1 Tax=Neobacillus thermocopriae TaxID=1215031 RepID=UPI002E226906|nr:hypothetical protein [Neobacillus thermocopriae]MED3713805.1 hypothetical protein [Neobacillus thermocopriae]
MIIEEWIQAIFETTIEMDESLIHGNFEQFEDLLNNREVLMRKVDSYKMDKPDFTFSQKAKDQLTKAFQIDQKIQALLKKNIDEAKISITRIKQNKQFSNIYQSYVTQTNGIFIDEKK